MSSPFEDSFVIPSDDPHRQETADPVPWQLQEERLWRRELAKERVRKRRK